MAGSSWTGIRDDLKARRFTPTRVREKMIPKASGKLRRLGIATAADRVVQAVLKLVLEPIFEADFKPCSYGFRPKRRAQDAIAEIHYLGSPTRNYEWVFEADITACFDEISHSALLDRMRRRIGDKRVLGLVKAFLRPGSSRRPALEPGHDHRHSARRDPLTVPGQHRPVRAGRALHAQVGSARTGMDARQASQSWCPGLSPRPLRGRLRGDGRWHPRARRSALGRDQHGARSDRLAPIGREDEGLPHRRGVRLPRDSASSGDPGEAGPASERSTPTHPRRPWPR